VQSGLAQASRHEGAHRASVALHWRPDALEIVIDDDGQMAALQDEDSSVEMAALRERLALYNGSIELGCTEEGCCILRARLPLEAAA
jgi:signal transduction histidine kinase